MLDQKAILQTQDMIDNRHLDIRTITMLTSLFTRAESKVYDSDSTFRFSQRPLCYLLYLLKCHSYCIFQIKTYQFLMVFKV